LFYENPKKQLFAVKFQEKIDILKKAGDTFSYLDSIPIPQLNISGIASSPSHDTTWLATTQGLWYITELLPDSFQLVQEKSVRGILKGVLAVGNGSLWISSSQGLIEYWPRKSEKRIRQFGLADGIQEMEYEQHAQMRLPDGRFAFGGGGGLDIFDPNGIKDLDIEARPTITEVLVNDEPAPSLQCAETGARNPAFFERLVLEHEDNTLSFSFAAMDYSDPTSNRFGYDLREKGNSPGKRVENDFARFPNLPPGTYEFELFATNSEGRWAEKSKVLEIVIKPPFWQTWWFISLVFLVILAAVYSVYRNRLNRVRKEAAFNQQVAEMETAILRLQMNPHFLFNSLNSIRNHIQLQEYRTADKYLTKFSKLMRRVLNLAAEELISLEEEKEILRNYVEVEQIRFPDRFHFEFEIAEELDPYEILVPSMLLQPFVENAILHAFSGTSEKGLIRVDISAEQEGLLIQIADNGIGRKKAEAGKGKQMHVSKATHITRDRLALLAEKHQQEASLEILDPMDHVGQSKGTSILLRLPLLTED
ncbi:MAG: histidine kinase, partial [Bacteroidota bacterium]